MTLQTLLGRNLTYYWRANIAVVLGVAVAVSVLAGALVVGESVRASLRELALVRLGRAAYLITSSGFFDDDLARGILGDANAGPVVDASVPLIALSGMAAHEGTNRRASGVAIYGVDERFWTFHRRGDLSGPAGVRDAWVSESLARELGAAQDEAMLVRVEKPSAIPLDSLHAHKDEVGRTVRLRVTRILAAGDLGEFALHATQGPVNAVFVPLARLQRDLEQLGRVNALLFASASTAREGAQGAEALGAALRAHVALEDLNLTVRAVASRRQLVLESGAGLLTDAVAGTATEVASELRFRVTPVLTYLANRMAVEAPPASPVGAGLRPAPTPFRDPTRPGRGLGRAVPYSLVTATDLATILGKPVPPTREHPPIVLNDWVAREMGAATGDVVASEYYVWADAGVLETRTSHFEVVAVVPLAGAAADPDLAPKYPGITEANSVADWDPPFPIDLARVLPADEAYWDQFRATPKAFIPIEVGQRLWRSRYGQVTSLRFTPVDEAPLDQALASLRARLGAGIDPLAVGYAIRPVRAEALAASTGATDFGEYFLYFSFFLLISALLLSALLFRLGIEQRARELGVLQAVGWPIAAVRRLFLAEGALLSAAGAALGAAGTIGYAALIMWGLRTWWVEAVGTTALTLRPSTATMGATTAGMLGGFAASLACIWWTLRSAVRVSPRALLSGSWEQAESVRRPTSATAPRMRLAAVGAATAAGLGLAMLLLGAADLVSKVGGFFGAGTLFLIAALATISLVLRRRSDVAIAGTGWWPVSRLGFRYATYRPGRSLLCITLIASAAFIIVAVEAFRRTGTEASRDPHSGTGGYALMAESALPIVHDPNTSAGRDALNLMADQPALTGVRIDRFRLRPGEDASCLNLYQPRNPRIVGATAEFVRAGRFAFQRSSAESSAERANPWLLLEREIADGIVPVIADANSLTYVLHLSIGDDFVLERPGGSPIRLRVVAALRDSVLQGELVMAEAQFTRVFPGIAGYRVFLIDAPDAPEDGVGDITAILEQRLADYGFDATSPAERLQAFHRVENTYLSTFQTLGALGLLLGTAGLAIVLWRNVLERRRDLALLRAVGYASSYLTLVVLAENVLLLAAGLAAGVLCAALAIAPALSERGGHLPSLSVGVLLLAVLATGLTASIVATLTALRAPLLASLRAE